MGLNSTEFNLQRRRVHAAFALRYALAGFLCFLASGFVWPARGSMVLVCLGYFCLRVSYREQAAERRLR